MHFCWQRDIKTVNHHVIMEGGFRRDLFPRSSNRDSQDASKNYGHIECLSHERLQCRVPDTKSCAQSGKRCMNWLTQDDISLPDVRQRGGGVHARSDSLGRVLKLRLLANIAETV